MNKKRFWMLVVFGAVLLLTLILASHVVSVGERVRTIHPYLSYAFYGVAVFILYVLVINPLRIIFLAPTFSIDALDEKKNVRTYKKAARTMLKLKTLTDEERKNLKASYKDKELLPGAIKKTFEGSIRQNVDATITHNAKTVLVTTAISQNGNLDMLSVIFMNIRMIRDIVKQCGFRPSYVHLAKLSVRVAAIAMIAENLENVDIREALPSKATEAIRDIPFVRTASNSIFQGISNGMLTARIGIVTRKYLFQDHKLLSKREMRLNAYKESFTLMPKIVGEGLGAFPRGIMSFMVRPFVRNPFSKKGSQE